MRIWNTEDLPDREQFAYWREALSEAFVTLRPERPRDRARRTSGAISREFNSRRWTSLEDDSQPVIVTRRFGLIVASVAPGLPEFGKDPPAFRIC